MGEFDHVSYTMCERWRRLFFPKLRVHIKDKNNSPHGKFHRCLFPFSKKFPDLNFAPYVLFRFSLLTHIIWNPYVTQIVSLGYLWSTPRKQTNGKPSVRYQITQQTFQVRSSMEIKRLFTCKLWTHIVIIRNFKGSRFETHRRQRLKEKWWVWPIQVKC